MSEMETLFAQFVLGLAHSGMIQLGKVMNPVTKKTELDLQGAKATIDLLMVLREKTKGNLSKPEQDIMGSALSSLQLNYVDEMQKAGKDGERT